MAEACVLSVIVPVGPGDEAWRELLPCLAALPRTEVIVATTADVGAAHGCDRGATRSTRFPTGAATACVPADGGQSAGLRSQPWAAPAGGAGVRWIEARTGRAAQQNAGACAARGTLLWFLHADSRPDAAALATVAGLPAGFDALGWFRLAFHDGGWAHGWNARGANLRARAGLPFGDQGLLISAARFQALGGFDEGVVAGEDLDLVVRARAAGMALRRLPGTVATSARRYRAQGWWRTTARHLRLTVTLTLAARRRLRAA